MHSMYSTVNKQYGNEIQMVEYESIKTIYNIETLKNLQLQ